MALKRIGIDVEIVDAVEIDKYAIASFNAIHNTNFETQDITLWDKHLKDIDLITHGSPCQDFSIAGKQDGGDIGSGTRSSLMYETIRIVGQVRPKYILWENVKNILSQKHKHNFDNYINTLNALGYNSYYQVLNAKDYGIPQNRERVFTISIRKDIDRENFEFPKKEELKLRMKDMLEDNVEEKYYLKKTNNLVLGETKVSWDNSGKGYGSQQDRAYYQNGLCPALSSCNCNGDKSQVALIDKIIYEQPLDRKGWHNKACEVLNINGITTCIHTQSNNLLQKIKEEKTLKIRKLTPKECWRLMGFKDEEFEKAKNIPTSNTQLYKQAGNSIVVNVLEKVFQNLFKEK